MKRNEFAEIKKLDVKTLKEKAKSLNNEVADLIIDKNMNKMTNLRLIKFKRDELAKVLTVLKQRQLIVDLEEQNGK